MAPAQILKTRPAQKLWCDTCSHSASRLTLVVNPDDFADEPTVYVCDTCLKRIQRHQGDPS